MTAMRVSLCLDPGRPWPDLLALAQRVDAVGWHAVYVCDHFMPHDPGNEALSGPVLECWSTLAVLAGATARVRLGSLVLGNTYRHPAVVANMAATLDVISSGRVVLGIGAGWQPNEHAAYGFPLLRPAERLQRLDEACAVIRSLLDTERSTAVGPGYQVRDAPCEPKPVQPRLPLLVGGGGERQTLRVAARHADVWHSWADPTSLAHKNEVLDQHCADLGRDPREISRASGGTVFVGAEPPGTTSGGDWDIQGTVNEATQALVAYREAGADEFIVRDHAKALPIDLALDQIDVLTSGVLPALVRS